MSKFFPPLIFLVSLVAPGLAIASEQKPQRGVFTISGEESFIHIYTGVAGAAKAASHKHLVSVGQIYGEVVLTEGTAIDASYAQLELRPREFLVDDDEARATALDTEYKDPVAGWIKSGTKKNMNGRKLLEADLYPTIDLRIVLDESEETTVFLVSINLKNRPFELKVPGELDVSDQRIRAKGDFTVDHKALGLKPFRAAGGLARVAKELRIVFDITAINESYLPPIE